MCCLCCTTVVSHSQEWAKLRHNPLLVTIRGRVALCLGFLRSCCPLLSIRLCAGCFRPHGLCLFFAFGLPGAFGRAAGVKGAAAPCQP